MTRTRKHIIHLYTFCYNEEFIIPYFLRHYLTFVSKIIVFDNYSTDRSLDLLSKHPNVMVKSYHSNDEFRDDLKMKLSNTMWKKSKGHADFIIVCDMDEFVYHPNMDLFLTRIRAQGHTVAIPQGYEMVSASPPTTEGQIYEEVKEGYRNREWNKPVLFDPNRLVETNFSPGAHLAMPEGNVKVLRGDEELKLLHFRYLGLEYLLDKHRKRSTRLSDLNKRHGWGRHYLAPQEEQIRMYQTAFQKKHRIL